MVKWQEVRGVKPASADVLVSAACRYLNVSDYPDLNTMAAIIGLEEVEVKENIEWNTEEEDSCEDDWDD